MLLTKAGGALPELEAMECNGERTVGTNARGSSCRGRAKARPQFGTAWCLNRGETRAARSANGRVPEAWSLPEAEESDGFVDMATVKWLLPSLTSTVSGHWRTVGVTTTSFGTLSPVMSRTVS